MRAVLVDPRTDPRWAELAATAPAASIFHQPAWLRLVAAHYRYPMAAACVLDGDAFAAGLPFAFVPSRLTGRRLVALPFSDVVPPLVAPGAPEGAVAALAAEVERERARRGVPLEIRAAFEEAGTAVERFHLHLVDLTAGYEETERRFASATRRNVKKAAKAGVQVERRTDREALDAFFELHLATRRRLGVPTQPKRFIRAFEGLFDEGLGFVALATVEGEPASAAVFLVGGRTLTYKYGASDERHLQLRPNNLLFADAIRWGCEHGLATLDMGRTDLGQEGLMRFKRSWGATEETLSYTYAGQEPPDGEAGRVEQALHAVITRSPPVAGRVLGELLYRHAG